MAVNRGGPSWVPVVFSHLGPDQKKGPLSRGIFLHQESHYTHMKKNNSSVLVYELVCISIHPVLWREGHFIQVATVVAAFTWLDEHSRPLETLAIRADKGHGDGACAPWRAAPSIHAHAAVVGPVEADTHTFPIGQASGLRGFLGWGALLPYLWRQKYGCHSLFFLIGLNRKNSPKQV